MDDGWWFASFDYRTKRISDTLRFVQFMPTIKHFEQKGLIKFAKAAKKGRLVVWTASKKSFKALTICLSR